MKRGTITVDTMPLCAQIFRDFQRKFKPELLGVQLQELSGIPSSTKNWNYLESETKEKREVTVISFGLPVQMHVNIYK